MERDPDSSLLENIPSEEGRTCRQLVAGMGIKFLKVLSRAFRDYLDCMGELGMAEYEFSCKTGLVPPEKSDETIS